MKKITFEGSAGFIIGALLVAIMVIISSPLYDDSSVLKNCFAGAVFFAAAYARFREFRSLSDVLTHFVPMFFLGVLWIGTPISLLEHRHDFFLYSGAIGYNFGIITYILLSKRRIAVKEN